MLPPGRPPRAPRGRGHAGPHRRPDITRSVARSRLAVDALRQELPLTPARGGTRLDLVGTHRVRGTRRNPARHPADPHAQRPPRTLGQHRSQIADRRIFVSGGYIGPSVICVHITQLRRASQHRPQACRWCLEISPRRLAPGIALADHRVCLRDQPGKAASHNAPGSTALSSSSSTRVVWRARTRGSRTPRSPRGARLVSVADAPLTKPRVRRGVARLL